MLKASSKLYKHPKASTLYLVLPSILVTDSQFPFGCDESVEVCIEGKQLVIKKK